jgi:arginine decarboxylase
MRSLRVGRIFITQGKGEAQTRKSAFDRSLHDANIDNLNLVPVSSIIPPGVMIETEKRQIPSWPVGSFRYAVLGTSSARSGEHIAAAMGWLLAEEGGIIIEQDGHESASSATEAVQAGLEDMKKSRDWHWCVSAATVAVEMTPVEPWGAVVVAAVYEPHL